MSNSLGNNGGRLYSFGAQPTLVDCSFVVTPTNGAGVTTLKGQGVNNVFMHTSTTPTTVNGYLNPNPAAGYALVQLKSNYNRFLGSTHSIVPPTTGSEIQIDSVTAGLTAGRPYVITTLGAGPAGACTIAPVADSAGSLASKYFTLYDSYGNTFVIWFSVSGVGSAPQLGPAAPYGARGLQYVQQTISSGATAGQIGTALVLTIQNLPSGINGVYSFTASGTTTVTVTSTASVPLAGIPQDGTTGLTTGFTFALTVSDTNLGDWQGVGLPKGLTPTLGQSFVATATGAGASTGKVKAVTVSGINAIEVIGNPSLSFGPMPMGGTPRVGGWVLVQFLAPTSSSVTTQIPTAPATGSTVYLSFYVDGRQCPSNGSL